MIRLVVVMLCFLPAVAFAGQTTLIIPDQHWQITFDAPQQERLDESNHPDQYKYFGRSGRLVVSLFVENPGCGGGVTHEAFYNCFWPKASRNPLIVKKSVVKSCIKDYCKVTYDVEATMKGRVVRQKNVNFLIAYRGKWTDLHVSVVDPTESDIELLKKLENSLAYQDSN